MESEFQQPMAVDAGPVYDSNMDSNTISHSDQQLATRVAELEKTVKAKREAIQRVSQEKSELQGQYWKVVSQLSEKDEELKRKENELIDLRSTGQYKQIKVDNLETECVKLQEKLLLNEQILGGNFGKTTKGLGPAEVLRMSSLQKELNHLKASSQQRDKIHKREMTEVRRLLASTSASKANAAVAYKEETNHLRNENNRLHKIGTELHNKVVQLEEIWDKSREKYRNIESSHHEAQSKIELLEKQNLVLRLHSPTTKSFPDTTKLRLEESASDLDRSASKRSDSSLVREVSRASNFHPNGHSPRAGAARPGSSLPRRQTREDIHSPERSPGKRPKLRPKRLKRGENWPIPRMRVIETKGSSELIISPMTRKTRVRRLGSKRQRRGGQSRITGSVGLKASKRGRTTGTSTKRRTPSRKIGRLVTTKASRRLDLGSLSGGNKNL